MVGLRKDSSLIIKPRDQRTARSEDRPVRIGPRSSKLCGSWSGPVSFEICLGPSRTNRFWSVDPWSSQNQNCQMFGKKRDILKMPEILTEFKYWKVPKSKCLDRMRFLSLLWLLLFSFWLSSKLKWGASSRRTLSMSVKPYIEAEFRKISKFSITSLNCHFWGKIRFLRIHPIYGMIGN